MNRPEINFQTVTGSRVILKSTTFFSPHKLKLSDGHIQTVSVKAGTDDFTVAVSPSEFERLKTFLTSHQEFVA